MLKWLECYNLVFLCLTRLYVLIICDACIILDGILVIQNRVVLFLFLIKGMYVVIYLIADDVWESEDELTGALSEEVEIWD